MHDIQQRYAREGARAVFEGLREVRRLDSGDERFWSSFLLLAALLCKSPVALATGKAAGGWRNIGCWCAEGGEGLDSRALAMAAASVAERTVRNGFAYERFDAAVPGVSQPFLVAVRLETHDAGSPAILCVLADKAQAQQFNEGIVRLQLISDAPAACPAARPRLAEPAAERSSHLVGEVTDIAGSVLNRKHFSTACLALVNGVASSFDCSMVCFGWKKGNYLRLSAVSHIEDFKADSPMAKELEALLEEAGEQDETICFPNQTGRFVVDRAHATHIARQAARQVVTLPVRVDGRVVGALTCEKREDLLSPGRIEALGLLVDLTARWLDALHYRDTWFGGRLAIRCRRAAATWFSIQGVALKLAVVGAFVLLLSSLLITWDYRVEGAATLQTDLVRYVSAPFEGVVTEVRAREGEAVKRGDILVRMDARELHLKRSQEAADIVRFRREADKSRAQNALADMRIAQAKVEELRSELERTQYNLDRASITALSAGIIVEGDVKKLVGAPVAKGDVLMKIAQVDAMYALVKVRERDIDEIRQGGSGRLVLLSRPDRVFGVSVDKVIPLAEVDQREGNIFVLKVRLDGKAESWWRPGMSGVAKIDAGRRTIAWIVTHRVIDFIRMYLWW